ncbi:hypothetical protein [Macrococcus carouselicus]|uniref:Uncharacterized protein n=1 Tax=Macrococcus carouselicus TaxID=69969 RepID=A0A9Q8CKL8_9STAP|nr:hypothetical protein [Macrococcus carouselicus]TDL95520.1 hypothetical protein ERX40_10075 [Macrococcus carouselicus]
MNNEVTENTSELMKEFYEPSREAAPDKEIDLESSVESNLFKSNQHFSDLTDYFKESHEYLTEIFRKLGDGKLRSDLSEEERDKLIKLLENYKDNMLETIQKATLALTDDITELKRKRVTSSVDTSSLKSLIYGSKDSRLSYSGKSSLIEPNKER